MRNTADVTGAKPFAILSQSISGVSAINPLVLFYDIHGGKREVLFFHNSIKQSRFPLTVPMSALIIKTTQMILMRIFLIDLFQRKVYMHNIVIKTLVIQFTSLSYFMFQLTFIRNFFQQFCICKGRAKSDKPFFLRHSPPFR
jgi:hypothetical protein